MKRATKQYVKGHKNLERIPIRGLPADRKDNHQNIFRYLSSKRPWIIDIQMAMIYFCMSRSI